MSKQRPLGNIQQNSVNQAAEKNIEMLGIEDTMIDSAHTMNHVEIKTRLMRMKILTLEALRHLESLGAPTRP